MREGSQHLMERVAVWEDEKVLEMMEVMTRQCCECMYATELETLKWLKG